MATPFLTLLSESLRRWVGARGFALVVVAALFPMFLTGAWSMTHQGDLGVDSLAWSPSAPTEGQNVTFTAVVRNLGSAPVGRFNVSIAVGTVAGGLLRADVTNTTTVEGLAPGATATASFTWPARAGVRVALASVDYEDVIGEREEVNNQKPLPMVVTYAQPTETPAAPTGLAGDANATASADLRVALGPLPAAPKAGESQGFTATITNNGPDAVTNATAVLRIGRGFGASMFPQRDTTRGITLAPGASETLTLDWDAQEGAYWVEAYVQPKTSARDASPDDNRAIQAFLVQPQAPADFTPPNPPDRVTIKQFYLDIFSMLQLRFLVPLIALFYAAGVLSDEREAGSLTYLLTRPMPRAALPVAKFLAGFAVAAVAVAVGVLGTYLMLIGGTAESDLGYLTSALFSSLVALFAYGGLFLLLGMVVDRPYLIGLAFVVGWETLAAAFVPWVGGLTLSNHVGRMLCIGGEAGACAEGWRFSEGVQWLPQGAAAQGELWLLLLAGAALVGAAAYMARRREFPA